MCVTHLLRSELHTTLTISSIERYGESSKSSILVCSSKFSHFLSVFGG